MPRLARTACRAVSCVALVASTLFSAGPLHADDVADEADLHFQIATEAYQRGDFRTSLEHYHASNRLAPNRAVLFNIGRAYEQLHLFPDAYRYYALALEKANDDSRARIAEAIVRITPNVAILDVETNPPGATLYIDRKNLGARGSTPRALAFDEGPRKVIVEKAGYEDAEATVVLKKGVRTPIAVTLTPILGHVRVSGAAVGAQVRVDDDRSQPICTLPCTLNVAPGRHVLLLSSGGFETSATTFFVGANETINVAPTLARKTGTIVVTSDTRDALVEIDGKPVGFTPLVTTAPVGPRRVRVSAEAFSPQEQDVTISEQEQVKVDVALVRREEVSAASRVTEQVEDAPSSVTVVSREELRAMAYPTIAEALRGVRGVYLTDDRSITLFGFRGFSPEFSNRVLVLVDGHPVNTNFIGQSLNGFDGRMDIDDIDRIEVVRGPGSVLYGTGAFYGVINLVTRSRYRPTHVEASYSNADYGANRVRVTGQLFADRNLGAWASASLGKASGRDFFFPEYAANTPTSVAGNARGLDGWEGAMVNGAAWYKALSLQWMWNIRDKGIPTGQYSTNFGDARNMRLTSNGFLELRFEPQVSEKLQVLTRAHVNTFRYRLGTAFPDIVAGYGESTFLGYWTGAEARAIYSPTSWLRLTLGGEGVAHLRARQLVSLAVLGTVLDRNDPYNSVAGYGLADVQLGPVKLSGGARYDHYSNAGGAFSPRLAAVYRPTAADTVKVIAGKAFRAPSVYELFYNAGPVRASNNLQPESVYSAEVEVSHRFSTSIVGAVSGFVASSERTIRLEPLNVTGENRISTFANAKSPILSSGVEASVEKQWRDGFALSANYSFLDIRYLNDPTRRNVWNAPKHLVGLKAAFPLIGRTLGVMGRATYVGTRYDRNELVTDPVQLKTPDGVVGDIVAYGEPDRLPIRYSVGIYNVADFNYSAPVADSFRQTAIVQPGRTFLAQLTATF